MHVPWQNCPTAWAGQYIGKDGSPTLVLEAVADHRTYIWHSFFGSPGSNNDININDRSPMWNKIGTDGFPKFTYQMSHGMETNLYYAADNIYPDYPVFMKSCGESGDPLIHYYSKRLEAVRKDVERAFGILQARFAFLKRPCLLWSTQHIKEAVECCIIMHNLIIEDQEEEDAVDITSSQYHLEQKTDYKHPVNNELLFEMYLDNIRSAQSYNKFHTFRAHLITHVNSVRRSVPLL